MYQVESTVQGGDLRQECSWLGLECRDEEVSSEHGGPICNGCLGNGVQRSQVLAKTS